MDRRPTTTKPPTSPRKRKPYRAPQVRSYGSIHEITQARQTVASKFDGAGGGGKTKI